MSWEGRASERLLHRSLVRAAYGLGAAAALTGGILFAGWIVLGPAALLKWFGPIYIKTNAALGLLLAGASLVLLIPEEMRPIRRWAGHVGAAVVLLLGVLTLSQHLTGWDIGIDQLLATELPGAAAVTSPNRMGPPAAVSLLFLGLALLLMSRPRRRVERAALHQFLALVVVLVALLPTIGYLSGADELYGIARYTGIAWPTAVVLLLLSVGVLCARPQDGLMAAVTADDPGGGIIRSLLLPLTLLPVVLGGLRLAGERQGIYEASLGSAITMLIFIIIISVLAYQAGRRVSRSSIALRQSESQLRDAQRLARIGSWYWDAQTDATTGSDELLRIFGLDPATQPMPAFKEQRGRCYPVEEWERINAAVQETMRTGVGYKLDVQATRNGAAIWVTTRGEVVRDAEDRTVGLRGTVQDITDRKQAEEAVRQSERLYRAIGESIDYGVWVCDPDGRNSYASESFLELVGVTQQQCSDFGWGDVLHPDDADRTLAAWKECVRTEGTWDIEHRYRGVDGQWHPILARGVPVKDENGKVVCWAGINLDISRLKQAEAALRASEERFELAARGTGAGIWDYDIRAGKVYFSPRWKTLFGYQEHEIGDNVEDWSRLLHPDEREWILKLHDDFLAGTSSNFAVEHRLRHKDGSYRWIEAHGVVVRDRAGQPSRFVGSHGDITLRKQAEQERERLAESLRQKVAELEDAQQELLRAKTAAEAASEAKSRFLANISHELRTPMNAILGMVDLALPKQVDPSAADFLKTARESADLLLVLLNDLLDCAKFEAGKMEIEAAPFNLRHALDQVTRMLTVRASEKGIGFSCRIAPEVPDALVGDCVRLRQILLNLGGNGVKFTERGEVAVTISAESQDTEHVCLTFAVRDTGIGIAPRELDRLFRPFAQADPSTTRRFGGTGLGLSIASSLVSMMGGRISVESEPARGSTFRFTIRLPLAKNPMPPEREVPDKPAGIPSSLQILLVEDNPANQKLAAYILEKRGHQVDMAGDGRQGLVMAQQNKYDAILMDVQMPVMDGHEATKAIRAWEGDRSHVPIIALTAHAMKEDRERCLAAGMDGYLSKPIDGNELIALLESLAAGAARAAPQPARVTSESMPAKQF